LDTSIYYYMPEYNIIYQSKLVINELNSKPKRRKTMKKSLQAETDKGNIPSEDLERFAELTGLSDVDFTSLLGATGWAVDDALKNMDSCITGAVGSSYSQEAIITGIKNAGIYDKLADNLTNLNAMRGGAKGGKGFVFEHLHAADANIKGQTVSVINNNGIADFQIIASSAESVVRG